MGCEETWEEKRTNSRLQSRMPVNYRVGEKREVCGGFLLDIGAGGLKLEVEGDPEVSARIAVVLRLPGEKKGIRVDGTAVEVTEGKQPGTCNVRVVFAKEMVEQADVARIRDYVEGTTELLLGSDGAVRAETFGRKIAVKEIVQIVEALKMSLDNERKACALGDIVTFTYSELDGHPPMTVGAKISEMLAGALMDKYGASEVLVNEALDQCRNKLNDIGKRYFMSMVRRKITGA